MRENGRFVVSVMKCEEGGSFIKENGKIPSLDSNKFVFSRILVRFRGSLNMDFMEFRLHRFMISTVRFSDKMA